MTDSDLQNDPHDSVVVSRDNDSEMVSNSICEIFLSRSSEEDSAEILEQARKNVMKAERISNFV
jgi:hypothetical protein